MKIIYVVGTIFLFLVALILVGIITNINNSGSNNKPFEFFINIVRNIFGTHDEFSIKERTLTNCSPITANAELKFDIGEEFKYKVYYEDKVFYKPMDYKYIITGIENISSIKYYRVYISEETMLLDYERKIIGNQKMEKFNITYEVLNKSILISNEGKILKKDTSEGLSSEQCDSFIKGMTYDTIDVLSPWMLALNDSFIMNVKYKVLYKHNGVEGISELNDEIRVIGEDKIYSRDCFVVEKTHEGLFGPKEKRKNKYLLWVDKEKRILLKGESYSYSGNLTFKIELVSNSILGGN